MDPRAIHRPPATAALRLRSASPGDAPLLLKWRAEASVRQHQPLADISVEQLRTDLSHQRPEDLYRGRGDKFQWIVLVADQPAGWITLVVTNWQHGLAEVGYALSNDYQGQGRMIQALEILLAQVFYDTKIKRLEARCTVDNIASWKVLERLGFEREGRLRSYFVLHGRRVDNYLYALLRPDYERARE